MGGKCDVLLDYFAVLQDVEIAGMQGFQGYLFENAGDRRDLEGPLGETAIIVFDGEFLDPAEQVGHPWAAGCVAHAYVEGVEAADEGAWGEHAT